MSAVPPLVTPTSCVDRNATFSPLDPLLAVTPVFDPCPLCPASRHFLNPYVFPRFRAYNATSDPYMLPGDGHNATFNQLTTRLEHEQAVQRCQENDPGGPGAANAWEVREEKFGPIFFSGGGGRGGARRRVGPVGVRGGGGGGGCAMHYALSALNSLSAWWVVSAKCSIVGSVFGPSSLLSPLSIRGRVHS